MLLQLATWPEVETYLKASDAIILPIGSTEQHGPNGLIGTDAISAEAIGRAVGERSGTLVGPTIGVGMAQHHMGFAGSMTLRPSTLIAVVRDYVVSLARHGFRSFYFINGHGGNIATVNAAFSEIYAESSLGVAGNRPPLRCELKNWWMTENVHRLSKEYYGNEEGHHATPSEVSVTYYLHPEAVKSVAMSPRVAPMGPAWVDAAEYRRCFPDGRIGSNPALATVEHGQKLFEAAVSDIAREFEKFRAAA
jgi:creatinine amidohydrolase